jgi:predicted nucleic acid-binding protein
VSTAVDTNVIIGLVAGSQDTVNATKSILEREGNVGALIISPPVYAECLAHPGWNQSDLDRFLQRSRIRIDWSLSQAVWIEAGLRFAAYNGPRRRLTGSGSPGRRLLTDFIIGAHALALGTLITFDSFFKSQFPDLRIVDR